MATFTLDHLRAVMRDCAGVGETVDLDGDIIDTTFIELDYDSLALLEIATELQQNLGLPFPDEVIERMKTPRDVIDYVNTQSTAA